MSDTHTTLSRVYGALAYTALTTVLCYVAWRLTESHTVVTWLAGLSMAVATGCIVIGAKVKAAGLRAVPGIKRFVRAIDMIEKMQGTNDKRGDWP